LIRQASPDFNFTEPSRTDNIEFRKMVPLARNAGNIEARNYGPLIDYINYNTYTTSLRSHIEEWCEEPSEQSYKFHPSLFSNPQKHHL